MRVEMEDKCSDRTLAMLRCYREEPYNVQISFT